MNDKDKTRQIIELLRHRHPAPQWASYEELMINTGHHVQRCDFFAFNCWPSKKFWRVAYEVKVSRGDFSRELNKPTKRMASEEVANECFFVAPAGLLKIDEIPEGWGLIQHTKGGFRKAKHAKQRDNEFIPIEFVANLARRAQDPPSPYPEIVWKYLGKDMTYEDLMKLIDLDVKSRIGFLRGEGKQAVYDSDYYKTMEKLKNVIRGYLGWTYGDPEELETWFKQNRNVVIDQKMKRQLENAQNALKDLLETVE